MMKVEIRLEGYAFSDEIRTIIVEPDEKSVKNIYGSPTKFKLSFINDEEDFIIILDIKEFRKVLDMISLC